MPVVMCNKPHQLWVFAGVELAADQNIKTSYWAVPFS